MCQRMSSYRCLSDDIIVPVTVSDDVIVPGTVSDDISVRVSVSDDVVLPVSVWWCHRTCVCVDDVVVPVSMSDDVVLLVSVWWCHRTCTWVRWCHPTGVCLVMSSYLCLWMSALKASPSLQQLVKFWMLTSGYLTHIDGGCEDEKEQEKSFTQSLSAHPAVFIWHQSSSASFAERVSLLSSVSILITWIWSSEQRRWKWSTDTFSNFNSQRTFTRFHKQITQSHDPQSVIEDIGGDIVGTQECEGAVVVVTLGH